MYSDGLAGLYLDCVLLHSGHTCTLYLVYMQMGGQGYTHVASYYIVGAPALWLIDVK